MCFLSHLNAITGARFRRAQEQTALLVNGRIADDSAINLDPGVREERPLPVGDHQEGVLPVMAQQADQSRGAL